MLGIAGVALILLGGFLAIAPRIGLLLGLGVVVAGTVLLVLAFWEISRLYGRPDILRNTVASITLSLLAGAVESLALLLVLGLFPTLRDGGEPAGASATAATLLPYLLGWATGVAAAFFFYKAVAATAELTGNSVFKLSGLAYVAGAVLPIVLLGHNVISTIAMMLLLVAFFTLKPARAQPTLASSATPGSLPPSP
ncbi:MAG: DUF996 domain-containing protein [Acidilobaceae archaeon]